jgi:hypothetical protein
MIIVVFTAERGQKQEKKLERTGAREANNNIRPKSMKKKIEKVQGVAKAECRGVWRVVAISHETRRA